MVLSLPFILAFIGSAVALIIGMVIYGDISEAIECPASGGGGQMTSSAPNTGSFSNADGEYFENGIQTNFNVVSGILNNGVLQEGTASLEDQGEIRFGTNSQWDFLHTVDSVNSNKTSINFWIKGDVDAASTEVPLLSTMNKNAGDNDGFIFYAFNDTSLGAGSADLWIEIDEAGINIVNRSTGGGQFGMGIPANDGQWHMITLIMYKGCGPGFVNQFNNPTCSNATESETFGNFAHLCIDGNGFGCGQMGFQPGFPNPFTGLGGTSGKTLTVGGNHFINGISEKSFQIDDLTIWHGYILKSGISDPNGNDVTNLYNAGVGSSAGATGLNIAPQFQVLHVNFDAVVEGGGGGSPEIGSEQCQQAKDISWTVIGIIPVALFFSLFAIFSALGTGRQ